MSKSISVAIDGPSGAGKSTIAKKVSRDLGFIYVDTGALYRAVGLYISRAGIAKENKEEIIKKLPDITVSFFYKDGEQRVLLNSEDVSDKIRTPEISMYASAVSAIPEVRAFLLDLQRAIAKKMSVIMDGRDIGTVILPDADVKIFLTASVEVRAKRRYNELLEKGESVCFEGVLSDMEKRDRDDSSRAAAPLKKASDAVLLDTSEFDLETSIKKIKEIIAERTKSSDE